MIESCLQQGLYFSHRQFLMDCRGHAKAPGPTLAMYSVVCVVCVCLCVYIVSLCVYIVSLCVDMCVCLHVMMCVSMCVE